MTADAVDLAVLAERISYERQLRAAEREAFDHERELRVISDAHEREMRLQTEIAVEKARQLQFEVYAGRLDALNHAAERMDALTKTFMPIDRFEREHSALRERYEREHEALIERHTRDIGLLSDKVSEQERVTLRQDTQSALLDRLAGNQRWMVGILVTVAIFGVTTALHAFGVI